MEFYRSVFIALLLLIGFQLFQEVRQEYVVPLSSSRESAVDKVSPARSVVNLPDSERYVRITTDVMEVVLDRIGGDWVESSLTHYPKSDTNRTPVSIFSQTDPDVNRIAQSDSYSPSQKGRGVWDTDSLHYTLDPNEAFLKVILRRTDPQTGVHLEKIWLFERGSYAVQLRHVWHNATDKPARYRLWAQIKERIGTGSHSGGLLGINVFQGGILSTSYQAFEKIPWSDITSSPRIRTDSVGGWLASVQPHFVAALVPDPPLTGQYQARRLPPDSVALSWMGPWIEVKPRQTHLQALTWYAGPQIVDTLQALAPKLDKVVDYGWFWPIASAIFWLLDALHTVTGNWGWSIVAVTVLIKFAFYPLSAKGFRSTLLMKKIQPEMLRLKEQYADQREVLGQETMKLYKKHGVNPLSGCLPNLVQIPVFVALYAVLTASVELRMAPWIGWIHDLSAPDPYYLIPLLLGASMWWMQRLNPEPPDPMMANALKVMPVLFAGLSLYFPAGLALYWVVSNVLSAVQQWWMMRRFSV